MRETFTAMLPVAGGGATFYQATGPFATEIIQRIANIAGLKSVDSMPDDAFGCRFTEIQREEAENISPAPTRKSLPIRKIISPFTLTPKRELSTFISLKADISTNRKPDS